MPESVCVGLGTKVLEMMSESYRPTYVRLTHSKHLTNLRLITMLYLPAMTRVYFNIFTL